MGPSGTSCAPKTVRNHFAVRIATHNLPEPMARACIWTQLSNSVCFLAIVTLRISLSFTDINECAPDPCQNGGNCFDQINNYTCKCLLGYTGKNCEVGECKRNGWIETYIETLPLLEGTSWSGFIANLQALKPGQLGPSSSIHLEVIYARTQVFL